MHCEFLQWKFNKLRWASTLNPKHLFVITSLTTTQIEYGGSFDEFSEDFLARFQNIQHMEGLINATHYASFDMEDALEDFKRFIEEHKYLILL
jgi:hypothetical protein